MDDLKKLAKEMSKNMDKLREINQKALESIMEHEPEKVTQIIKDNNDLKQAFEKKDLNKIINIQQKYADYDNK